MTAFMRTANRVQNEHLEAHTQYTLTVSEEDGGLQQDDDSCTAIRYCAVVLGLRGVLTWVLYEFYED